MVKAISERIELRDVDDVAPEIVADAVLAEEHATGNDLSVVA